MDPYQDPGMDPVQYHKARYPQFDRLIPGYLHNEDICTDYSPFPGQIRGAGGRFRGEGRTLPTHCWFNGRR